MLAGLETEGDDVVVFAVLVVTESVLVVADVVSFLGFGAGGGGRIFTALDDTTHHIHAYHSLMSSTL